MHETPKGKKDFLSCKPLFLERMQRLKDENNITSERLAEYLEMPLDDYLNTVESPDKYTHGWLIHKIADFFDVELDYLYGFTKHLHDEFYDSDIFVYLSERLKKLERINGFPDEKEIADFIEISENEYLNIRQGKRKPEPSLYVLANLANYFNISLDYLIGRSNNPERQ